MNDANVCLTDFEPAPGDDVHEILAGLTAEQKTISPKYFYDETGSKLFDAICDVEEYYPTRTELAIMDRCLPDIVTTIGPRAAVIEYGAGSSLKTRMLLDNLDGPVAYMPVDISRDYLLASAGRLATEYPGIEILPICADFTKSFDVPAPKRAAKRNVVYFPGSTIGNFSNEAAANLLAVMRGEAGTGGGLLIGIDMVKPVDVLERAYNDSQGLSAAFNLNILARINRDYGADFDVDAFEHSAVYDLSEQRIEMRLISRCEQVTRLDGVAVHFDEGEYIVTEHSHKYTLDGFAAMASGAGFRFVDAWTDNEGYFSVLWLVAT